jgi:hypothetical protein
MIELACPSCRNLLEVDEGFRGGVCRCFNCGTLLTVPEEEQRTEAEVLSPTASPAAADVRPRTYTTRSGKTVSLSPQQVARAPVARRPRKSIRVAVRVAAVVLALLLAGGVGLLAYVLFAPRAEKARVDPYAGLFDIEHNPYTWDEPNFMGLPVGQTTVLLIESSAAMRNHLDRQAGSAAGSADARRAAICSDRVRVRGSALDVPEPDDRRQRHRCGGPAGCP